MSTLRRLISLCTPPAPAAAVAPLPRVPQSHARPSVLIVEDHAEVASFMRRALEPLQTFTEVSAEGETAVAMAEIMHFDLIVLDILLPGISGFEVCRTLRQTPHLREVPVIFVSGVSRPETQAEAARLGGVCFLSKPLEVSEFQTQVKRALGMGPTQPKLN